MLTDAETRFINGPGLDNLLNARANGGSDGWFLAAPGYGPYGNYVWHRDNAECVLALDEYALTFGRKELLDITAKTLVKSFRYFETKKKGVDHLVEMRNKLANPEFYYDIYHIQPRLRESGDEIGEPWHNIQYDSVSRMVVALAKHLALTRDEQLFEKCRPGLEVAISYLFDAIWDTTGSAPRLTVSANEWEEKDEPHLRGPLFSSVVGLLYSSSRFSRTVLQEFIDVREIDLKAYERSIEMMMVSFFVRGGAIRMIKRFDEIPLGSCSSALWLLTTYDVFPVGSEIYEQTLRSLTLDGDLSVQIPSNGRGASARSNGGGKGLRRYKVPWTGGQDDGAISTPRHVDTYWGGQAWVITTAQLATALAMKGEVEEASRTLSLCLETRDADGRLPEQFEGTYHDRGQYENWMGWSRIRTPAPWLAWSHAEVLRAYAAIHRAS